ncbi:hypothetical protein [Ruegeria sp.]|uniref:hypothetical protein n=1 Tax=Ruegeria sp. TaxID=1879320 RepID=UPI002605D454|nr:hypothetical protein [Ruegeria sp.]
MTKRTDSGRALTLADHARAFTSIQRDHDLTFSRAQMLAIRVQTQAAPMSKFPNVLNA